MKRKVTFEYALRNNPLSPISVSTTLFLNLVWIFKVLRLVSSQQFPKQMLTLVKIQGCGMYGPLPSLLVWVTMFCSNIYKPVCFPSVTPSGFSLYSAWKMETIDRFHFLVSCCNIWFRKQCKVTFKFNHFNYMINSISVRYFLLYQAFQNCHLKQDHSTCFHILKP